MEPRNLKTDFDEIFKEAIIPFFKELGFRRKAQHFARQTNDITQCVNVQRSQWNSYLDHVSFTFNIGFFNEDVGRVSGWENNYISFPQTTDCFISDRLGHYSHGLDHWYELTTHVEKDEIMSQVKYDLNTYLSPLFEKYQSISDFAIAAEMNSRLILSPYIQIILLMMTGQTEKGALLIIEQYKIALTPRASTHTTIYPDGRSGVTTSKPRINQHYTESLERLAKHYGIEL